EPGWIHRGLGDLIADHGVPAEARAVSDLTGLAQALSDGPVIVSVSFRFPTNGSKGGHLVLITGPTWTNGELSGFFFNDPSRWGANNSYVTATRFDASFTGRIIATTT
ncbi:MAG: hypothetical protein GY930_13655, partial [bacterium]|nr:hypothetical protein [bacterium]